MGGDYSKKNSDLLEHGGEGASINAVSDEEIPYTSFSVVRPEVKPKKATQQDIVVVRSDPHTEARAMGADPVLQRLEEIPLTFPVIRTSVNRVGYRDLGSFDKLEHRHALLMCLRYQRHLRECAEAVACDQNALTSRLKDLEMISAAAVHDVGRMQSHVTRMSGQLQRDVLQIQRAVETVESRIQQCVPMLRRLNNVLAEEERLEEFRMLPDDEEVETEGQNVERDGDTEDGDGLIG